MSKSENTISTLPSILPSTCNFSTLIELDSLWEKYKQICNEENEVLSFPGLLSVLGLTRDEFDFILGNVDSPFREKLKLFKNRIENEWVQGLRSTPAGCSFYLKNAFKDTYQDESTKINIGFSLTKLIDSASKELN